MNLKKTRPESLANSGINTKIKLAFLWMALMFLSIYTNYFRLITPGKTNRKYAAHIENKSGLVSCLFLNEPHE